MRLAKQEAALLFALCDLGGLWTVPEVTGALTRFADAALQFALMAGQKSLFRDEEPPAQEACGYVLLAMGKYGAGELNYSSDIDVIALYEPDAPTARGKDSISHFVKLTQKIASLMQDMDEHGYVFRTDLRLRPDPGATKVAISLPAALHYYETLGQNWERAAMIKARPAAGQLKLGKAFLKEITPFIWRKYLDFAALQDIHAMKRQIHAAKGFGEVAVIGHNLKLGRGGIREIEFFAQTQQLIAGGRNPDLRVPQTEAALAALHKQNWLSKSTLEELITDYRRLRALEHRVQMLNDEQTHCLPKTEEDFARFARFCGFEKPDDLKDEIKTLLTRVSKHYDNLFAAEEGLSLPAGPLSFTGDGPDPDTVQTFTNLGFERPEDAVETVRKWHYGRYRATQTAKSRERLTALTPALITAFSESGMPDQAIANFDAMLARLPAGLQFFGLLRMNPSFRSLLVTILSLAPRLTDTIIKRPHVVDAVLDPSFFNGLHTKEELKEALDKYLESAEHYEDVLDRVRYFGQEQKFMIGVLHLSRAITSSKAAEAYSYLANLIIDRLLKEVQLEFAKRHGVVEGTRLAIIGMGRLGAMNLTYESDLDLIFIYDHAKDAPSSDGAKPLDPVTYFTRLGQRFIAALSAPTAAGTIYEVDMRLRPSGRSGPLATSLESFKSYQETSAWTWEHLALTKAQVVAGDDEIAQDIHQQIKEVLARKRDAAQTVQDVLDMRERLHAEKPAKTILDVKNGKGGLMDLELLTQTITLLYAQENEDAVSANPADVLAFAATQNIISPAKATELSEAYEAMQTVLHLARLTLANLEDEASLPLALKSYLAAALEQPDFSHLENFISEARAEVDASVSMLLPQLRR